MAYNPKQIVTRKIATFDFDKGLPDKLVLINDEVNKWEVGNATAQSG